MDWRTWEVTHRDPATGYLFANLDAFGEPMRDNREDRERFWEDRFVYGREPGGYGNFDEYEAMNEYLEIDTDAELYGYARAGHGGRFGYLMDDMDGGLGRMNFGGGPWSLATGMPSGGMSWYDMLRNGMCRDHLCDADWDDDDY